MSGRRGRALVALLVATSGLAVALTTTTARAQEPHPPAPVTQPVPHPTPQAPPNPTPAPEPPPSGGGAQPDPTPQPAPTPPSSGGSGGGGFGFGWLNPANWVSDAVNLFFSNLVVGSANSVLRSFGETELTTPNVTNPGRPRELWGVSLAIANSAFVLLVLVAGMLLMGGESEQTRYTLKDVGPRLVVGFAGANLSLLLAGKAIDAANALSGAFLDQGAGPHAIGPTIQQVVLSNITGLSGLLSLVVLVLALVLSVIYVVRLGAVMVLVAGAPLCLACYALPHTAGLARMWWRAFTGALAVQVVQAAVLVTAMQVFFDGDGRRQAGLRGGGLIDVIVVIALLWVLVKVPVWIGRTVSARSGSSVLRIVKTLVVYRTLGAVLGGPAGAAAGSAASRQTPRPRPQPQPTAPGQGTLW